MNKIWTYIFIALFIGFTACNNNDDFDIDIQPGTNLVGKVMDGDTPLEGVVVSDGFTTVVTDVNGIYQMKIQKQSKFVFVSVPADCEIPHENNIPAFYKKLGVRIAGEVIRRDFNLKKMTKKDKFYLLAMADVQIANSIDLTLLKEDIPKISAYVQTLTGKPVYGISLGDLVWDNMPYYAEYTEQIRKIGVPVFQVIGNHDHNMGVINDDAKSAKDYEESFGPTYYSYNIGDCHFIVLDDVEYSGGPYKGYKGKIAEAQLEWLKQDLKYVSKEKLIVLGMHIPTKRRVSYTAVQNNQDLYDILEGYKVRILSGHTHNNFVTTITDDIEENTIGAVCGAFWTGDLCNDGSPRGYAIYEIDGNQISDWYYKGTNHDRDYQMKLYPLGAAITTSRQDGIIVNIFSWHSNWIVKVSENGGTTNILSSNIKEIDREAYDYMNGTDKPSYRPTVADPEKNNDHMFYYKPSNSWTSVKIEATTPYGNTYIKTINKE